MEVTVRKAGVAGNVRVPSSKSILQRYLIAGLLADGITELKDVSHCRDTLSCLSAIRNLSLQPAEEKLLRIAGCNGNIRPHTESINCGESGFALRALSAVAALSATRIVLNGVGSLLSRPVDFFEKVFSELDVECRTNHGFLPVSLKGPVHFRNITVDGSVSSQFLSGLLMVFPLAEKDHVIEVTNLKSKLYVDLTLQVMKEFGVSVTHENYKRFYIQGNQQYKACTAVAEGDWSGASFFLVAGATAGKVTIENLKMDSLQPDKAMIGLLKTCGALVTVDADKVTVAAPAGKLLPFHFDATGCPDLFPPLVALAAQCDGNSEITGVERLIHKESNRATALQLEFNKLNKQMLSCEGNKMIVHGGMPLKRAVVDSHNDHRIAMALAIAGLRVEEGINIQGAEAAEKSFPDFFGQLFKITI